MSFCPGGKKNAKKESLKSKESKEVAVSNNKEPGLHMSPSSVSLG